MFSINNPKNSCKTKTVKTSVQTGIGPGSNLFFSNGVLQSNCSNQSVPNLECIINSTKEKLTYDIYDPARNKPIPPPPCSGLPFIIQINTNNTSAGSTSNNQFKIPMVFSGKYNFIIYWGDSSISAINSYTSGNSTHTYASPGIYTIIIEGTYIGWSFNNTGDRLKLLDIVQWGDCFRLGKTEGGYFYGASNMSISAIDMPNLTGTTSLLDCFRDCSVMNSPNLIGWDVSGVTNMTSMFAGAINFNQNIGEWDTTNVTNMSSMFQSSTAFNNGGSSMASWSAPKCTNFVAMFQSATSFNQPLTSLVNTSGVLGCTMTSMFAGAINFNQNIGGWNLSNVTNMASMFLGSTNLALASKFNNGETGLSTISGSVNLATYNANTRVLNCPGATFTTQLSVGDIIFLEASSLIIYYGIIQTISSNTSLTLTALSTFIFFSAGQILSIKKSVPGNTPLNWDTSRVTDMDSMFGNCIYFNQDLSSWTTPNVTDMSFMFNQAVVFNNNDSPGQSGKILLWDTTKVTNMIDMFRSDLAFNQDIKTTGSYWNVGNVTNISGMFRTARSFNKNISNWNTSKNTSMSAMFYLATSFNNGEAPGLSTSPLNWDVSNVTIMESAFRQIPSFNQPIGMWDTTKVTNMSLMFQLSLTFNQNIGGWNLSNVTVMLSMFQSSTAFNNGGSSMASWSAPKCTNFVAMFQTATSFNQPLTSLVNTSGVLGCTMNNMFQSATSFNQNIGGWNLSNVTNMASMFQSAIAFNNGGSNSIQTWSAPLCTTFVSMFQSATSFNQPLTSLVDTSGVSSCILSSMFSGATNFNKNIGSWNTSNVTNMSSMFVGTISLSTTTRFNNGETGLTSIPNVTPSTSSYINATKTLTCPGATFNSSLSIGDVLIIQTTAIVYSSSIQSITNNTTLILTTAFGSDITLGTITSINKQVVGTAPLNWNTAKVTSMANMFQYCIFFNQNITKNVNIWNTSLLTTLVSLFQGSSTSLITLFNNGQIITGTTAPMGWTFTPTLPSSTNYRTSCRLTNSNKPALLA